jgi:hypothetical protein
MTSYHTNDPQGLSDFLTGKPETALMLFDHFISEYGKIAPVTIHPAKSMIGIANPQRRIAWVTQFGKNFLHVVFPFDQSYEDNLCFTKIAQVPGQQQFNHHFRMLQKEDVNDEVRKFMRLSYEL